MLRNVQLQYFYRYFGLWLFFLHTITVQFELNPNFLFTVKVPNMKPRKPLIKLPSLSDDDSAPPAKIPKREEMCYSPSPSTSLSPSPRTRSQSTLAKIRGITNEIRQLSYFPKSFETKLKRPLSITDLNIPEIKKQKLD